MPDLEEQSLTLPSSLVVSRLNKNNGKLNGNYYLGFREQGSIIPILHDPDNILSNFLLTRSKLLRSLLQ